MVLELKDDWTVRDLIDRCIKAEIEQTLARRQVTVLRQAVRAAQRAKTLERVQQVLESASSDDLALELARP